MDVIKKSLYGNRRIRQMDKTITVVVDSYKNPIIWKRIKVSKKFHVHDEEGLVKFDRVTIMETNHCQKQFVY